MSQDSDKFKISGDLKHSPDSAKNIYSTAKSRGQLDWLLTGLLEMGCTTITIEVLPEEGE